MFPSWKLIADMKTVGGGGGGSSTEHILWQSSLTLGNFINVKKNNNNKNQPYHTLNKYK